MSLYYLNGCFLFFASLVTLCILVGNLMERFEEDACYDIFHRLVILDFIYNVMGSLAMFYIYGGGARYHVAYRFCDVLLSLVYFGLLLMFSKFLVTYLSTYMEVSNMWLWIARSLVLSSMILRFIYLAFADGPANSGAGWEFELLSNIGVFMFAVLIMVILVVHRYVLSVKELVTLMTFVILPTVAALLKLINPGIITVQMAMTLSVLLINNFLHMNQAIRLQEQEKKLTENQIQIMMSQIRPHFLFNVLNTIYILCESEPLKAQEAINHFSRYLRANLDYLTGKEIMIPFRTELEHVDHYLELEKMRYGDELQIIENITAENFWVPALTVQPIIENAVKHGIHSKSDGGTIVISTSESGDYYEICIRDNGKGFDPGTALNDGKQHIGLRNVSDRLNVVCGGKLLIESTFGEGTTVRMQLPKTKE